MKDFGFAQLSDPEYFRDGCEMAHSDHRYYRTEQEMREKRSGFQHSLNGVWKFHYAENPGQTVPGFEQPDYSCRDWADIRVPAHIQLEGYDRPQYVNVQYPWEGHEALKSGECPRRFNPVASYVKYFALPQEMQGERIFLVLEGAESAAAVWLNGSWIGYHEDSFTPAEFELTDHLCPGENKLCVQVFKWCSGSWCEDQDFFRFSGLYRPVWLRSIPKVHVRDLKISAELSPDLKSARLSVQMQLTGPGCAELELCTQDGFYAKGTVVGEGSCLWQQTVENPRLWSGEDPFLYDLKIRVSDEEGTVQEYIPEKVGFRRFELRDSLMCLNGKRIEFRGVNRHEFSSTGGRCITEKEIETDLRTMKQNNINAIRTSHYPNSSALYRLCDEYGIYLIDEMNLETHGTWDLLGQGVGQDEVIPKDKPEWQAVLLDRAQNLYERDKNHPSVLIWSCGNESYGGSVIHRVSRYFRRMDSGRLVHYEGIFHDRSYPDTSDMESRMYPPAEEIRAYLKQHREKPFICCEYCHAMGNSCGGLHEYTRLCREEPLYQGGFIWDYIDQSLTKKDRYGVEFQAYGGDFGDRPNDGNFSGDGIVYGGDRSPSPKMQEVKFLYQSIEVQISEEKVQISNRNLFTGTDRYDCRVEVKREGCLLEQAKLETAVPPQEERTYPLPVARQTRPGEYTVTVSFRLKEDTRWAPRGHEVAFGQTVYRVAGKKNQKVRRPLTVVRSNHNIGVQGDDFEAIFSLAFGGLVSYRYGGTELLEDMPKPSFWRAPTDNDRGSLMQVRYAQWKLASLYASARKPGTQSEYPSAMPCMVREGDGWIELSFCYHLPTTPPAECSLRYRVSGDGTVAVTLEYDRVEALGDMPEFGVLFTLNADFNRVRWYGLGPEETYADRKHGAKLDVYENRVTDNLSRYLVPQECGNKEEVRYASITDRKGRGLLFTAGEMGETMSFSALPYTPHQLEEASHPNELPPIHHTIVRVLKAQMGVGGDDSWGARTHPEYLVKTQPHMQFAFSFRGI